ncbi:MAG: helicase, partial [Planctomycetota bacterium]|nr:helicase [Planctomycetota bacterium]
MAEAVEEALADGRHLVVEAGTGVGKSFAYLVPALIGVAEGAGPVVIATRTIALQEQLVEQDVPFLIEALEAQKVKVALAKGRGNYVCRRRLAMAHAEGAGLFDEPAKREQLTTILEWAETSADGTRSDLSLKPAPDVWDAVKAESGNCLHQ